MKAVKQYEEDKFPMYKLKQFLKFTKQIKLV